MADRFSATEPRHPSAIDRPRRHGRRKRFRAKPDKPVGQCRKFRWPSISVQLAFPDRQRTGIGMAATMMDMNKPEPVPAEPPTLERIVLRPGREGSWTGWLSTLLCHPWGAMLLQDPILCRILAILPLPLLALPLLHLPGWPCMLYETTGIPCPGCGMTRAILCLLRGEVAQALRHHAMAILAAGAWLVLAMGAVLPAAWRRTFADALASWERRLALSGIVLAAFFLFGMGRMALAIWARLALHAEG